MLNSADAAGDCYLRSKTPRHRDGWHGVLILQDKQGGFTARYGYYRPWALLPPTSVLPQVRLVLVPEMVEGYPPLLLVHEA